MSSEELLTPIHPRWNEFIDALSRTLICAQTTENARQVLTRMGGVDIEETLGALRRLGGHCDCEIVFDLGGVAERTP